MRTWDVTNFERPNLPAAVAQFNVSDRQAFSRRESSYLRVLDLPIYMPGQGWRLPPELGQFRYPIVLASIDHEGQREDYRDLYCYITVDQKPVPPGESQRRPGWHTDAFVISETGGQQDLVGAALVPERTDEPLEYTYVMADCLPTLFHPGPFRVEGGITDEESMRLFSDVVAESPGKIFAAKPYELLRLDPYVVHDVAMNLSSEPIERTFIKIQFSARQFNREGNAHNPLFDYSWEMVPRDPIHRGHRSAAKEEHQSA